MTTSRDNPVHLSLYFMPSCPFCQRVLTVIGRQGLHIERLDVDADPRRARELVEGGGQDQVPCLRIQRGPGSVEWLYESADIIDWLERNYRRG